MTEDQDLVAQLREAGHVTGADRVRDAELARQLEAAGHTDLAAKLKGEEPTEQLTEREEFIRELKEKNEAGWTSAGNLLEGS